MLNRVSKHRTNVNIIPLIDVLTALIFFFIITMNFKSQSLLNITPPEVKCSGHNNTESNIVIGINKRGEIYFNDSVVSYSEFTEALKKSATINPSQSVLIVADEDSELKNTTRIIDCCKKNNLNKLHLQTR